MMEDYLIVENIEYKDYTIKIMYDEFNDSPRDWDNLGTMLCWHNRYELGDKNPYKNGYNSKEVQKALKLDVGDFIALPLYLYDHSGITMSTGSFHDIWDSGQVGFIYVSKDKIRKEYSCKHITKKILDKAYSVLEGEVKTYDQFLRGEIYGYVVEDENGENIDSCWCYYELDYCVDEAKSSIDYYIGNNTGNGVGI